MNGKLPEIGPEPEDALEIGHKETIRFLLPLDICVAVGWTPLMAAAWRGKTATVRALVAAGADVNARNEDGMTALMVAAKDSRAETVAVLLSAGADRFLTDKAGRDALWHMRESARRKEGLRPFHILDPAEREAEEREIIRLLEGDAADRS